MINFNLYKAYKGWAVVTRQGINVHLFPMDSGSNNIHGVLDQEDTKVLSWNVYGRYSIEEHKYDLFLVEPQPHEL